MGGQTDKVWGNGHGLTSWRDLAGTWPTDWPVGSHGLGPCCTDGPIWQFWTKKKAHFVWENRRRTDHRIQKMSPGKINRPLYSCTEYWPQTGVGEYMKEVGKPPLSRGDAGQSSSMHPIFHT